MKKLTIQGRCQYGRRLSMIMSVTMLLLPFARSAAAVDVAADEAEVLALDQKFGDAAAAGDVAAVERMLAPDFSMVHGDQWTTGGKPFLTDDKKTFLERVANRQYGVIEFGPVKAEMHGDVAITYGRYVATLRANAGTDRAWFRTSRTQTLLAQQPKCCRSKRVLQPRSWLATLLSSIALRPRTSS
jgi:ketosteroid isomerase-like protein